MPKARIKLASTDIDKINSVCDYIKDISQKTGVEIRGPIPLPTKNKKWTVNRSTFVHKNAREQFEMRTHTRLVDILDLNPAAVEALNALNLPAGVDPVIEQR